jgi:hypothetical protein
VSGFSRTFSNWSGSYEPDTTYCPIEMVRLKPDTTSYADDVEPARCCLKNATVRCQASLAAFSS